MRITSAKKLVSLVALGGIALYLSACSGLGPYATLKKATPQRVTGNSYLSSGSVILAQRLPSKTIEQKKVINTAKPTLIGYYKTGNRAFSRSGTLRIKGSLPKAQARPSVKAPVMGYFGASKLVFRRSGSTILKGAIRR